MDETYNVRYEAHAQTNNPLSISEGLCMGRAEQVFGDFPGIVPHLKEPYIQNELGSNVVSYTSAYERAAHLGAQLLKEGNKLLEQTNLIGEGPKTLRAFCFLGGLCLVVSSVFSVLNIFSFLTGPSAYILEVYLAILGIITMVVEAKDVPVLEPLKPFIYEWFKFLTVPGGKGIFYFFIGSIAISLWASNILLFIVGIYICSFGIICILVHMGLRNQLRRSGIEVVP